MAQHVDKKENTLFRSNKEYCQERENCERQFQITNEYVKACLPPSKYSKESGFGFNREEYREALNAQGYGYMLDSETKP